MESPDETAGAVNIVGYASASGARRYARVWILSAIVIAIAVGLLGWWSHQPERYVIVATLPSSDIDLRADFMSMRINEVLLREDICPMISGSAQFVVSVPASKARKARRLLQEEIGRDPAFARAVSIRR